MPSLEEIRANGDKVKKEDTSWRDDMKWINHGELNAYLFMFGDNRTGFREIRLALYKE